ncbi:MAG: tetratricopeptide repeat protein [Planctomycetaceae bacterium]|nr:tetratricopeptide repeat protein [Planctomycetaceae bacterium]
MNVHFVRGHIAFAVCYLFVAAPDVHAQFILKVTTPTASIKAGENVLTKVPMGTRMNSAVMQRLSGHLWAKVQVPGQDGTGWISASEFQVVEFTPNEERRRKQAEEAMTKAMEVRETKPRDAVPLAAYAVQVTQDIYGSHCTETVNALGFAGITAMMAGDPQQAERFLKEAVTASRNALGPSADNSLLILRMFGFSLEEQKKDTEAMSVYDECIRLHRSAKKESIPLALAFHGKAKLLEQQNSYQEAAAQQRESLKTLESVHGPQSPELIDELHYASRLEFRSGDLAAAEANLRSALQIAKQNTDDEQTFIALMKFGDFEVARGQFENAISLFKESHALTSRLYGVSSPETTALQKRIDAARAKASQ